ncbi:MAG: hypothetical protein ACOX6T_00945 [Myxococcales bacterium]
MRRAARRILREGEGAHRAQDAQDAQVIAGERAVDLPATFIYALDGLGEATFAAGDDHLGDERHLAGDERGSAPRLGEPGLRGVEVTE